MKRIWLLVAGVVLVLGIGAVLVFGLGNGPKTYTVEITSNVEQIEYESKNNCRLGDTIIIDAIPIEGYRFIGWEVKGVIVSDEEKYEITLNEDNVNNEYKAIYEKLTFNITMPTTQTGYTINDTNNETFTTMVVEYGDSISFKVELKTGYTGTPVVKNNRQTITADNDVYTISNVTSDVNITITGVKRITYTVTVPSQQTGYTINDTNNNAFTTNSVQYGDSVSFKVLVNTGYNGTPIVRNNNDLLTPSNDIYTISNVTSDVNITVEGITANAYTLTSVASEVTVTRGSDILNQGDTIYYNEELTLSSTPTAGMDAVYTVNGTVITGNTFIVAGNVTIEYSEKEHVDLASTYGTLTFTYDETNQTATVNANTSNKPTGELVVPNRVIKDANGLIYEVTKVGSFDTCTGLTEITIPNSVTSMGDGAFCNCSSLTSITIPNSVTSISGSAFYGCSSLTSVIIPNSVTSIGSAAFYGCSSLNGVTIENIESWLNISFGSYDSNPLSYAHHLYIGGNEVADITIPEGITEIKNYAFSGCSSLSSITVPDSVTSMGSGVFGGCSSLENITLPFVGGSVKTATDKYQYPFGYIFGTWSYTGATSVKQYYYGSSTSSTTNTTYYIPSSLRSVTITGGNILRGAFYGCSILTSITIPNSVTSIGNEAFRGCSSLTSVSIPDSVTSIGSGVFGGCSSLESMTLPFVGGSVKTATDTYQYPFGYIFGTTTYDGSTSVTQYYYGSSTSLTTNTTYYIPSSLRSVTITGRNILRGAFYGCSMLTNVSIPEGVTSIGISAFRNCCSLTSITIPDSVTSIGDSAFGGCSGLISMTLPFVGRSVKTATNTYQYPFGYIFGTTSYDGSTSVTQSYYGSSTSSTTNTTYYIPSSLRSVTITGGNILYGAFYRCSMLTNVSIPDGVTGIGQDAFRNCSSLTSISIPDSVTSIGSSAFYNCISLTSITIPDGVTSIGNHAFENCSRLTSVTIGSGVTKIYSYAFENCSSLTSITIPNGVTSIDNYAFSWCYALAEVYNKSALNITKGSSDYGCVAEYAEVVYSGDTIDTPTKIYFSDDGIAYFIESETSYIALVCLDKTKTTISLDSKTTRINGHAFYNCSSLTSVTIPDSVTSIGSSAFRGCSSLTSVTIPNSVTSMGDDAFYNCSSLTSVTISNGVTSIGDYAFRGCSSLTSITIPDSVTSIGDSAFYNCSSLTSVTIGSGVTSIDNYAFSGCYALAEVYNKSALNITKGGTINGRVAYYAEVVYSGDTIDTPTKIYFSDDGIAYFIESETSYIALVCIDKTKTTISLDSRATKIRQYAFYECSNLTSVIIPNSVTSIGDRAFNNCTSLTSVTIGSGVTSIGSYAFSICSSLTSITIPDSVTSIGSYAFSNCSSLTSITIPDSVTSIGFEAFRYCSSITSVTIGSGVTSIGNSAFENCSNLTKVTTTSLDSWLNISFGSYDSNPLSYAHHLYIGNNEVTELVIPEGTEEIKNFAFYGCSSLTSITIPNSVTSIGSSAFYNCSSLTSVTIGSGVTGIGQDAFYNCSGLTSVIIPNSVTSIGNSAFSVCSSLTSITIPESVTSIGNYAFENCSNLTRVTTTSLDSWLNISFGSYDSNPLSYAHHLYIGNNEVTELIIPDGITEIKNYAFSGCSSLTSITILDGVTSIGSSAFYNCSSLTSVTIGGVTNIGNSAFSSCSSLTSITIPNSVTFIDRYAFNNCAVLNSVTFENPNGWFVTSSKNATSGTDVTLTDPSTNATYLKSTYRDKYWKRSA